MLKWSELRKKRKDDYAHFIEWKEFPILGISLAKSALFLIVGLGSILLQAPVNKTLIALICIGACGYLIEGTFVFGRPLPTPGYRMTRRVCKNCSLSQHDDCSNLRMLDGFEKQFKAQEGYKWPVCCCGFRLGEWEEIQV